MSKTNIAKKSAAPQISGENQPNATKHLTDQRQEISHVQAARDDFRKAVNVLHTTNAPNPFLEPDRKSRANTVVPQKDGTDNQQESVSEKE